jgi:ABC-2 type transport system ATP-binding protein
MSLIAASASNIAGTITPKVPVAASAFSAADAEPDANAAARAELAATATSPPLAAEAITVRYGRRTAVDGVSLSLRQGTVYALLGRNGAGKSSLVRCLLGQQRATSGRALLFGHDAWRRRASLMAQVGVVPEQPDAPPGATASQLARLCRPLYPRWDGSGFEARLRRFDVPADLPFGRLSKGQQGHVALALALAPRPRLLVLDDPTLGLDAVARLAFFEELIGELADRGTTVFLTTHDLAAVERIADRAGILAGGRLLLDEEIERLKQRFRSIWLPSVPEPPNPAPASGAALRQFSPLAQIERNLRVETLVGNYDDERFQAFQASAPGAAAEASSLTLEEIFIALTGGNRQPAPIAEGGPR